MIDRQIRPDIYISADVETDGPVPGRFSLLSFGLSVVGRYDGRRFERSSDGASLYRELKPISENFQAEAMEVNGLDRDRLALEGADPSTAMAEAAAWVRGISDECRPILVAYPVAFDWSFLYWYFESFGADSPFGHSSCLDIRTLYQAVAGSVFDRSGKSSMPEFLQSRAPHTHNSLDDAVEQGELFANLFLWAIRRRQHRSEVSQEGSEPSWLRERILPIA
jgi:Exonuclease